MTMSYAYHPYQTEVFPTAVRARAAGLVYSMSRISAMFSGFIVAYMLKQGGVSGVFGLITTAMVIVIVALAVFGPTVAASRSTHNRADRPACRPCRSGAGCLPLGGHFER